MGICDMIWPSCITYYGNMPHVLILQNDRNSIFPFWAKRKLFPPPRSRTAICIHHSCCLWSHYCCLNHLELSSNPTQNISHTYIYIYQVVNFTATSRTSGPGRIPLQSNWILLQDAQQQDTAWLHPKIASVTWRNPGWKCQHLEYDTQKLLAWDHISWRG